jgi:PPM family protein phosphatase
MSDSDTNSEAGEKIDLSGIVVRVFGRTDVGLVREHNEDNFLVADLTSGNRSIMPEVRTHKIGAKGSVFAVCDGMGGAAAGEVASRIGVDTIYEILQVGEPVSEDVLLARRLNEAICEAGSRIFTAAKLNRGQRGMGTTVTAAVLNGPRLIVGQVGDSRAHVVRRGVLVQVTKDQSLVQQLIDAKQLTVEEAREFDRSNIILQALGTAEDVHVDMTSVELRRGDAFVMCSDGLSGRVEPDVICRVVVENDDPMEACRKLTDLACQNGGDDNITVIVARFDGEDLAPCGETDAVAYERFEFRQLTETTVRASLARFYREDNVDPERAEKIEAPATEAAKPDAAQAPAKAETPAPVPEEKKSAPAPSPAAAAKKVPPDGEAPKNGRPKVIAIAFAAVLACVGLGYALTRGSGSTAPGTEAGTPIAPTPAAAPATAPRQPAIQAPAAPAPPAVEEPSLAPVPEKVIVGTGDGETAPKVEKNAKDGSKKADQASKPQEPKANAPAKKKKPEPAIEENPY